MKSILIIGFAFLLGCQSTTKKVEGEINKNVETTDTDALFMDEPSYEALRAEYLTTYNIIQEIDTILVVEDQLINVELKHFCLFDTLIIPSKYNWSNTSKEDFLTHNFASNLLLIREDDTLSSLSIRKEVFETLIDENLLDYGVLLYPNYRGYNKEKESVQIQYSISIPLTDVGKGVVIDIGLDGTSNVHE